MPMKPTLIPNLHTQLVQRLWDSYKPSISHLLPLFTHLPIAFDHFAIIDLSSPHSGIPALQQIFEILGFVSSGAGYLPDKCNDFAWMIHPLSYEGAPLQTLPQVVIADFRNHALSPTVRTIVEKYAAYIQPFDFAAFRHSVQHGRYGDQSAIQQAIQQLSDYINKRSWPLPTSYEYQVVFEENQLLAWTLLFGRKINHFGLPIYAMPQFGSLKEFNNYIGPLQLNTIGGEIKGNAAGKIEQSSTLGRLVTAPTADAIVEVRDSFLEFVWRYPLSQEAHVLRDYFTGFIPQNANNVVESLYTT